MPSRKAADGEYRDIAHPINSETRDMIQSLILNKYETTSLESLGEPTDWWQVDKSMKRWKGGKPLGGAAAFSEDTQSILLWNHVLL